MKLEVPQPLRRRLTPLLKSAGRREIGGILMAQQLEPGHFRLADFSVDSVSGSRAHFVRSPEHHREALAAFFAATGHDYGRFNYLGEWHSHPGYRARPSTTDIGSMLDLIHSERGIPFAALLIVKLNWFGRLAMSATMFEHGDVPQQMQLH